MLKRLTNKSMMYHAVQHLLNQNAVIWEPIQAMADAIQSFESLLEEIEKCKQITGANNKGITQQKAAQQQLVIGHTYEFISVMIALSTQTNNAVLAGKVNFTETTLLKKRDTQLILVCTAIAELATGLLADLTAYGITEGELTLLKEEIKLFDDNLPTLRVTVSQRKATNEKMKVLFLQVDDLLKNQLDRLMVRYRKSHPDFYVSYQNARRIINYGIRHKKAKEPENQDQKQ